MEYRNLDWNELIPAEEEVWFSLNGFWGDYKGIPINEEWRGKTPREIMDVPNFSVNGTKAKDLPAIFRVERKESWK